MRIPSGVTDQYIYFVALDPVTGDRETGLSSFTVYRSRNGLAAAAFTTPTVNETDATNMPGVYELLLDEDMTIASGNDSEEVALHITQASMLPVTRVYELYRPKITAGSTLGIETDGDVTKVNTLNGHTAQTGDSFARIGAPAGASIAADLVVIDNFVDGIETAVITNAAGADISADLLVIDNFVDGIETAVIANATGADIAADIIALKAETVLIVADTNELQTDDIPGTLGTPAGADVSADIAALKAETALIVADTDELQGDWVNTGRLDTILDAIKTVTDKFVFTVANLVDSNMLAISGDTAAADALEALMDGTLTIAVNDASATTTAFAADGFTETVDDIFKGRLITFLDGANQFEQTDITGYDAAGGAQGSQEFTVTALTAAPANNAIAIVH